MPKKPRLGAVVWKEAEYGVNLSPQAERVLHLELFRLGVDGYTEINLLPAWKAGEDDRGNLPPKRVDRLIRSLREYPVILLFGTDVTRLLLDKGIARILGLKQFTAFLPRSTLIPAPHPGHVPDKLLGEFRHCLEVAVKEYRRPRKE